MYCELSETQEGFLGIAGLDETDQNQNKKGKKKGTEILNDRK